MFTLENWKSKLVYATFGLLCAVIGMLISPVTAQRDNFGYIKCTSLTVVGKYGIVPCVVLATNEHGGIINISGTDLMPSVLIDVNKKGGGLSIHGKDSQSGVVINTDLHGGKVDVYGKKDGNPRAFLRIVKDRGVVMVRDKGKGGAFIAVDKNGL